MKYNYTKNERKKIRERYIRSSLLKENFKKAVKKKTLKSKSLYLGTKTKDIVFKLNFQAKHSLQEIKNNIDLENKKDQEEETTVKLKNIKNKTANSVKSIHSKTQNIIKKNIKKSSTSPPAAYVKKTFQKSTKFGAKKIPGATAKKSAAIILKNAQRKQTLMLLQKGIGATLQSTVKAVYTAISSAVKAGITTITSWPFLAAIAIIIVIIIASIAIIFAIINASPMGMITAFMTRDPNTSKYHIQTIKIKITEDINIKLDQKVAELKAENEVDVKTKSYNLDWKNIFCLFATLKSRDNQDFSSIKESDLPVFLIATWELYEIKIVSAASNKEVYLSSIALEEVFLKLNFSSIEKANFMAAKEYNEKDFWTNFLNEGLGGDSGDFVITDKNLAAQIDAMPEGLGKQIVLSAASRMGWIYSQSLGGRQDGYADCSSLVQSAAKDIGISIPRTTWTQVTWILNNNKSISRSQLKEGDIIYWSDTNQLTNATHTGIYVGNGMVIDASSSKGKVVYRKIWGSHVLYARLY